MCIHSRKQCEINGCMIQYFEWSTPEDQNHWKRLEEDLDELNELGIKAIWIPPASKGQSKSDVGYGAYDLWDLGEFDQKGSVATKYGVRVDLLSAMAKAKRLGISIYLDVVLNHKAGADESEKFLVSKVDPEDRNRCISDHFEIAGFTKFTFPGRGDKYSDMKWTFKDFSAVDYDDKTKETGIYKISPHNFSGNVDKEHGNFDYLMCANIDYKIPDVREEIKRWAVWVAKELGLRGFRLDAVKHIDSLFIRDLLHHVRTEINNHEFFAVGEFWSQSLESMTSYLIDNDWKITLMDVHLHFNFVEAANKGRDFDMRKIFDGTLVQAHAKDAVTFVDNHDTQPDSAFSSWVPDWFKIIAYALILLRQDGYPCIFGGDFLGVVKPEIPSKKDSLRPLLIARQNNSFGVQEEYFDHPNCVGWVRRGTKDKPQGLAVVLSNGEPGQKRMAVGSERKGQKWHDLTDNVKEDVVIGDDGFAEFKCAGGSVSVWVPWPNSLSSTL